MTDKPDEWIAIEYVIEVLDDIRKRLRAGSEGPGATLDADECVKVLGCLVDPPFPNSRPPLTWLEKQDAVAPIAQYCLNLESSKPLKVAVKETAEHFHCSTSTVYAARRTYIPWPRTPPSF
jgi:hypothetical protein